jgi:hippurate hydrolase
MTILNEAKAMGDALVAHRRFFHENAEIRLEMPNGSGYVKERLRGMGYEPVDCGRNGVVAVCGKRESGKVFLLRADMDALPFPEDSSLAFKSKTGYVHACGHDFHVSMLLGAAQMLKKRESELNGRVKLMFQPGEETLEGARAMLEDGLMDNPSVDAAMMIHVFTGSEMPTGTAIFSTASAASSDWFEITAKGKGCHGAMSDLGVDPLNMLNHIYLSLQALNSREVGPMEPLSLTVGQMAAGTIANAIPDCARMAGTLRTLSAESREFAKKRITEISQGVALTFRGEAEVVFTHCCPVLSQSAALNRHLLGYTRDLLGETLAADIGGTTTLGMGSEDFAFVAEKVPGALISLAAGARDSGFIYPMHHPKAAFDEEALPFGAAVYANAAIRWLADNCVN